MVEIKFKGMTGQKKKLEYDERVFTIRYKLQVTEVIIGDSGDLQRLLSLAEDEHFPSLLAARLDVDNVEIVNCKVFVNDEAKDGESVEYTVIYIAQVTEVVRGTDTDSGRLLDIERSKHFATALAARLAVDDVVVLDYEVTEEVVG